MMNSDEVMILLDQPEALVAASGLLTDCTAGTAANHAAPILGKSNKLFRSFFRVKSCQLQLILYSPLISFKLTDSE